MKKREVLGPSTGLLSIGGVSFTSTFGVSTLMGMIGFGGSAAFFGGSTSFTASLEGTSFGSSTSFFGIFSSSTFFGIVATTFTASTLFTEVSDC